ncbi:DNA primase [Streptomyces litchfieldiae]|uniref:DNA primase n=1 Tax=Streptomyces litchfieldiae TaxID=3075543 RepID=A0ABU2MV92_9ACTN|nr:DNA primase [Streptomyces sp. DSM 44938]MDT0345208.1 DNA primase [Streptomyces sp. DSM 44938]
MAGRINDEDVKAVRDAVPIDAVVSEYLQLRPAGGGNLKGLCPFHDEKSPSFHVSPSKGLYHCLAGETRVLTWEGVKPIRELAGGTHRVLTRNGNWYEAPFRSFGVQRLMKITIGRNHQTKIIHATPEHRWFVWSGRSRYKVSECVTSELKPGRRLSYVFPGSRVKQTTPSPFGIAHGITFGDGTLNGTGSMAQLDPVKDGELLKYFHLSDQVHTERQIRIHHLPKFFKSPPPLSESVPYLYGWLAGYVAADGHVAKDGTVMLNSADRDTLEYVRTVCTRLGIGTYGITEQVREGFPGREPSSLFRVHFVNEDLTEEFFVHTEHRKRFADARKSFSRRGWVVKAVEETERVEEVFCATVEQGHAFVLEDNILTGNCFGCQEGGDTLAFVMKMEHLSFSEAVERLAAQAGITLRYEQGGYSPGRLQGERTRLIEAHKVAAQFYAEQLASPEAEIGRRFLADRGFDQAAAERFAVGYAPAGWDHLVRFLRGRGFTDRELLTSGIAQDGRRGPIDRFRGRLIWPIRDITGEVVGFGARKLRDDDNGPKYLNTPETPIYRKSQVLYGIDLAKRDIAKDNRAVVVEGYTDVMACHLAGVTTAIATCGTAFGGEHVKILRRVLMDSSSSHSAGEVVFTFDGDSAGQKAALRAFEDDQKFVARTWIAVSPGGMDPCELRIAKGDEAVRELIDSRTPLFQFAIESVVRQHNVDTAEGRSAALDFAAPIIAQIKDASIRRDYAVRLAGLLGILDEGFVVRRISQVNQWGRERQRAAGAPAPAGTRVRSSAAAPVAPSAPAPRPAGPPLNLRSPAFLEERELLKLALQFPALVSPAFDAYGEDEFTAAPYAVVRRAIGEAGGAGAADDGYLERVAEAAPDDGVRTLIRELAVEPLNMPRRRQQEADVYAGRRLVQVRLAAVDRRIRELESAARRAEAQHGNTRAAEVRQELWALEQYRTALKERGVAALYS